MDATKQQATVSAIFGAETPALADFVHARELVHSSRGEKEALEGLVEGLCEAYKASRSPQRRPLLGLQAGAALWVLNRFAEAAVILEGVTENPNAAYVLGICYLELDRPADAIKVLKNAAKKADDVLAAAMALAEAYRRNGENAEAMKIVAAHENQYQDQALLHCQKARCLEEEGEYGEAVDELEKAISLDPEHGPSLFRLAFLYDTRGEDARAIELYRRCAGLQPAYTNALVNLGVLFEDQGRYDEAIRCYRRVLKAEPNHQRARLL